MLVVNPYKLYEELYSKEVQAYYTKKIGENKEEEERMTPHVYAVAAEAIMKLERLKRNQSILISGESGAGKTEANKEVLRFVAKYYGSEDHKVEEKVHFFGNLDFGL